LQLDAGAGVRAATFALASPNVRGNRTPLALWEKGRGERIKVIAYHAVSIRLHA
jgi:hypothetical protein